MNPTGVPSPARVAVQAEHLSDNLTDSSISEPELEPPNLSVEVATNLQAVEDLRPAWTSWTHNLDTDIDYYLHNLRNDPTVLHPYVIAVYQAGIAEAILVGLVRKRRISTVVSFVAIRGPKVRALEIVHRGRLGQLCPAIDKLMAAQLFKAIKSDGVDILCFHRLALRSELFREVQQLPSLILKERVPHTFCYSVLSLTASAGKRPPAFSGKINREISRKTRILQRAFPGRVRFKCYSQPNELDAGIRDAAKVAAATWQHYVGSKVLESPRTQESFKFCASQGWLRIYVLYIDDLPRAFMIGQLYKETFYCQHAGYDRKVARFSVGSLLTAWALENLAGAGVQQVVLGEGGQEHNRRLGCQRFEEGTVHVYSHSLRGLYVNIFVSLTGAIRAVGRHARWGLRLDRVGKVWRELLIARWASNSPSSSPPEVLAK